MTDTKQPNPRTQEFLRTLATAGKHTAIFVGVAMFGAIIASLPADIYLITNGNNAKEIITAIARFNGTIFVLIAGSSAIATGVFVGAVYAVGISKDIINDPDLRRDIKKQISKLPHAATVKFNALKNKIANWNIRNNVKTK